MRLDELPRGQVATIASVVAGLGVTTALIQFGSKAHAEGRTGEVRALLSAAPSLHAASRRERVVLRGEPPSPANPPSGCVFRTRCPSAIEACAGVVPALETRGDPAHRVACIRHDIG